MGVPRQKKSGRAIRYKSSQSSAIATLCCGLFTTIPHAVPFYPETDCKYKPKF